jgi:hypothetical protein
MWGLCFDVRANTRRLKAPANLRDEALGLGDRAL